MGTRRERDTGRRDSLGRRIMESFSGGNNRAQPHQEYSYNDERQRIQEEFARQESRLEEVTRKLRTMPENRVSPQGYFRNPPAAPSQEDVNHYHNAIGAQRGDSSVRRISIEDPMSFYTVEEDDDEYIYRQHDKVIDEYLAMGGVSEEDRAHYFARVTNRTSKADFAEPKTSSGSGDGGGKKPPRNGGNGGGGKPPRPPQGGGSQPPPEPPQNNSGGDLYTQFRQGGRGANGHQSAPRKSSAKGRGSGRQRKNTPVGSAFSAAEKATGLDKLGAFRVTWRPRVGPVVFNMGRQGLSSMSLDAGPLRYMLWSRNNTPGFSSLDLPSGLSFRGHRGRK